MRLVSKRYFGKWERGNLAKTSRKGSMFDRARIRYQRERERERKKKSREKSVVQKNSPEARKILEYRTRCTKQNFAEFSAIAHCKSDPILSINGAKHILDLSPNLQMLHSNITQQGNNKETRALPTSFPPGPLSLSFLPGLNLFSTLLLLISLLLSRGKSCVVSLTF